MSELLERLMASVHAVAGRGRETIRIEPFTAYVDAVRTPKWFSFALPDSDTGADAAGALPALREAFAQRDRNARTEHFEELTPALTDVLEAEGWILSERMPVMICAPAGHVAPPVPEGLDVAPVGPSSTDTEIREYYEAQRAGFGDDEPVTPEQIDRFRRAGTFAVAGRIDGRVVGVANATGIELGVVEVGGVSTLPEFRGRGIAGALTAASVAAAFAAGAELAWLTAADASAERIYARAGFAVAGTQLAYDAP